MPDAVAHSTNLAIARKYRRGARIQSVWGWLPTLSLTASLGLLTVAAANRLAGSGINGLEPLFWVGLLILVIPIIVRQLTSKVSRLERLGLVIVFGLGLYLVKILQSPFAFTYSDEFIHIYNANQILDTGHLFASNPILPVSALYPGVEIAAAALRQLTGLDIFGAGLVIIGLGRLIMILGLFLLFERLSGSARSASLATTLYTANSNFLFWSAQFSYESLALPLAILVLYIAFRRQSARYPQERLALTFVALVVTGAVVVTHHLSSYFLAAVLFLWVGVGWLRHWLDKLWRWIKQHRDEQQGKATLDGSHPVSVPSGLALFAGVAAIFWLLFVANLTLPYLSPMFTKATASLLSQLTGDEPGRGLFHSPSGSLSPLWERVVGIASVLFCLVGLPLGLWQVWRRYKQHLLALLLAGAAIAYFGLLGLRLVPSAWEISNRASEFLFLGLAFVLAISRAPHWLPRPILAVAIGTIFAGGIVAGWPASLRLAGVYQVPVGDSNLRPPGLSAALWTLQYLGPNHRFAADESNGRFLLSYGNQNAWTGRNQSIKTILESPDLKDWQIELLHGAHTEYLAVDRRLLSADNMLGYFFTRGTAWPLPDSQLLPLSATQKFFLLPGVNRIYDSGDLAIYDIRTWNNAPAQP
jgi:hypothetical protein